MSEGRLERPRLGFERDFTMIPNAWLRDSNLTLKARGLLGLLMSHEPGYSVTVRQLMATNQEGRASIDGAVAELKRNDYLSHRKERNNLGHITAIVWVLQDPAEIQKSRSDQNPGFPAPGKPGTRKTRLLENPRLKEDHLKEDSYNYLRDQPQYTHGGEEATNPAAPVEPAPAPQSEIDGLSPGGDQSLAAERESANQRFESEIHKRHPAPVIPDYKLASALARIPSDRAIAYAAEMEAFAYEPCPKSHGLRPCSYGKDGLCLDCGSPSEAVTDPNTGEVLTSPLTNPNPRNQNS